MDEHVSGWFKEYAKTMRKLGTTHIESRARWIADLEDRQRLAAEFLQLREQTYKPADR